MGFVSGYAAYGMGNSLAFTIACVTIVISKVAWYVIHS